MTVYEAISALGTALMSAFTEWTKSSADPSQKTWLKTLLKWSAVLSVVFGVLWYVGKLPDRVPDSPIAMKEDVAAIKAELAEIKAMLAKSKK